MNGAKYLARSVLLTAPGRLAARLLARGTTTVVMLHRFTDARYSARGFHTAAELRQLLAAIRSMGTRVHPLADLFAPDRDPSDGGVVFTVDDGFADFFQVAWPVFKEFDCPATVFLTTGFLDGQVWPWWEQVLWGFDHAPVSRLRIPLQGALFERSWSTDEERARVVDELLETLKTLPDDARVAVIGHLAGALSADIPHTVPDEHAAMSWADVRTAAREGASFGPHTVSHPILSRVDDARAESEIAASWQRVRDETAGAIPVFCYPNGDAASFSQREIDVVRRLGLVGAVSAIPGIVTRDDLSASGERRFRLPRHACPHDPTALQWLASGWEHLRSLA